MIFSERGQNTQKDTWEMSLQTFNEEKLWSQNSFIFPDKRKKMNSNPSISINYPEGKIMSNLAINTSCQLLLSWVKFGNDVNNSACKECIESFIGPY